MKKQIILTIIALLAMSATAMAQSMINIKVKNNLYIKMVYVEGGTFIMGATPEQGDEAFDREKPAHQVSVSSFYIGQTEVTQELWKAVMGKTPSYFNGELKSKDNLNHNRVVFGIDLSRPVEQVSWNDCQEFIKKLNKLTKKKFRLPTEAEWEYAARGGKNMGYKYSGSNNIDDVAWYDVNCYDKGPFSEDYGTHSVATKEPNELGIYDMAGNVCEWCQDYWSNYDGTPNEYASCRVIRGGSWASKASLCRVSQRQNSGPDMRIDIIGLRLAM